LAEISLIPSAAQDQLGAARAPTLVILVVDQDPGAVGRGRAREDVVVGHQQARAEHEPGPKVGLIPSEDLEPGDRPGPLSADAQKPGRQEVFLGQGPLRPVAAEAHRARGLGIVFAGRELGHEILDQRPGPGAELCQAAVEGSGGIIGRRGQAHA